MTTWDKRTAADVDWGKRVYPWGISMAVAWSILVDGYDPETYGATLVTDGYVPCEKTDTVWGDRAEPVSVWTKR